MGIKILAYLKEGCTIHFPYLLMDASKQIINGNETIAEILLGLKES